MGVWLSSEERTGSEVRNVEVQGIEAQCEEVSVVKACFTEMKRSSKPMKDSDALLFISSRRPEFIIEGLRRNHEKLSHLQNLPHASKFGSVLGQRREATKSDEQLFN